MSPQQPATQNRYIPFRQQDLVEMCLLEGSLREQSPRFRRLVHMLESIYHFEFHQVSDLLKSAYALLDPDSDTRDVTLDSTAPTTDFMPLLEKVLDKANYKLVSQAELEQALQETSLFPIRLQVNFDDFDEVLLFCRGETLRSETLKSFFGLRQRAITFTNYDRVVVYLRFRVSADVTGTAMPVCRPGATMLKLFQNVPKADLEMLFPNTRIRMRTIDKLLIGIPAVVSGGIVFTTKVGATLVLLGSLMGFWLGLTSQPVELNQATLIALFAGIGTLGGYLWKQFHNFKNRKLRFMQLLTQNLYFKNLDNNAGVFHRLINDAEEEECKEAMLAYYFLLINDAPLSREELDSQVEDWLRNQWQCEIDFEVDDALDKLVELQLLQREGEKLSALPLDNALQSLEKRWGEYFSA